MLIHQLHQLRAGKALDETADFVPPKEEEEERVWVENHTWRTNFPPPDDFNGDEEEFYGEHDYSRSCTLEERAILDRRYPTAFDNLRDDSLQADEATRDSFFAGLAEDVEDACEECAHPEPVEGSVPTSNDVPRSDDRPSTSSGGAQLEDQRPSLHQPPASPRAHPEPVEACPEQSRGGSQMDAPDLPHPEDRPSTSSGGAQLGDQSALAQPTSAFPQSAHPEPVEGSATDEVPRLHPDSS